MTFCCPGVGTNYNGFAMHPIKIANGFGVNVPVNTTNANYTDLSAEEGLSPRQTNGDSVYCELGSHFGVMSRGTFSFLNPLRRIRVASLEEQQTLSTHPPSFPRPQLPKNRVSSLSLLVLYVARVQIIPCFFSNKEQWISDQSWFRERKFENIREKARSQEHPEGRSHIFPDCTQNQSPSDAILMLRKNLLDRSTLR